MYSEVKQRLTEKGHVHTCVLPARRPHLRMMMPIILKTMDAMDDEIGGLQAHTNSSLSITRRLSDGRRLGEPAVTAAERRGGDDAVERGNGGDDAVQRPLPVTLSRRGSPSPAGFSPELLRLCDIFRPQHRRASGAWRRRPCNPGKRNRREETPWCPRTPWRTTRPWAAYDIAAHGLLQLLSVRLHALPDSVHEATCE